jgi:exopolysaccharide biosynthesis WecB/TagA/CpsF family protein
VASLRIVQVVTQLEGGGAQGAALRVAEGLRHRGHEVETWFLYRKGPAHDDASGIRILFERPPVGPWDYVRISARLLRELRAMRPDALVSYTHYANLLGQTAALVARVPSRVASQRNPSWRYPWAVRWWDRWAGSWGVYTANVMVSESVDSTFERYPAAYRRRVRVVPNAVRVPHVTLPSGEARSRFSIPGDGFLVVTVGRLSPQKNQTVLVEALGCLPGVRLAVAGEGPLRAALEEVALRTGVQHRLHLLGELEHREIPNLLGTADVFALPSTFEGMSNALLEAMAMGLPVVASDTPAQREILEAHPGKGGSAGILLPPDEPRAWAEAIRRLRANGAQRRDLGSRARRRAGDFPLERMVEGFEAAVQFPWTGTAAESTRPEDDRVRSYPVLGATVHPLSIQELHTLIREAVKTRARIVVASLNLHGLYLARSDPKMRRLHREAYVRIDGMPLVWAARLKGYPVRAEHRVTWMDWMRPFMAECARNGWRVFYLGSRPEVAERAGKVLREEFPGLELSVVPGFFDPRRDAPVNQAILQRIRESRPDVLVVGMGMPRQEHWILDNLEALETPAILTSGAAMEYVAGAVATPPRWMGRIGLEWSYRLIRDPRRFWERYLIEPWLLAAGLIRDRFRSRRPPGP